MKIDFVITELDMGGAERCLSALAVHAQSEHHQVRVIALGPKPPEGRDGLVGMLESHKITLHFLNGRKFWEFPWVLRRLMRVVQCDRPDLAQSFLFHANVASAFVYPKLSIPLVGGIRVAEPRAWRHRVGRWAASKMKRVVCVSQGVAEWCRRCEGVASSKVIVIPNGVELASVKDGICSPPKTIPNMPTGTPFLLFVGRLDYQKGVDELMLRADRILTALPDWHLVLVGEGPLQSQLERERSAKPTCDRIHLVGWQDNPRGWMAASQLVILPARYEGMPNVILEAMAEGKAIVATDTEGMQDLLGELATDQVSKGGDFEGWERKVIDLATRVNRRIELGEANRNRIAESFQLHSQLQRYLQLYSELLCSY